MREAHYLNHYMWDDDPVFLNTSSAKNLLNNRIYTEKSRVEQIENTIEKLVEGEIEIKEAVLGIIKSMSDYAMNMKYIVETEKSNKILIVIDDGDGLVECELPHYWNGYTIRLDYDTEIEFYGDLKEEMDGYYKEISNNSLLELVEKYGMIEKTVNILFGEEYSKEIVELINKMLNGEITKEDVVDELIVQIAKGDAEVEEFLHKLVDGEITKEDVVNELIVQIAKVDAEVEEFLHKLVDG